jgi:hypothetical protein
MGIHPYPTESSLIFDGVQKVITLCTRLPCDVAQTGWRQHAHLLKKVKSLHRQIGRVSASKKRGSKKTQRKLYKELLSRAEKLMEKAENSLQNALPLGLLEVAQTQEIQLFIDRTRQVLGTARRRVIVGEKVPNSDKLFSIFEPHTQLYRRGKAGQENQFGRLLLVFEDGAGFISHYHLMGREETDAAAAVEQTKIAQQKHGGAIEKISFDRGFDSPLNEAALEEIVPHVCLPKKPAAQLAAQLAEADETFQASQQRHSGVESAIGALQAGNGMQRCRDHSEVGFERYLGLAILGRNLHTLGKLLIARQAPASAAAASKRKPAA